MNQPMQEMYQGVEPMYENWQEIRARQQYLEQGNWGGREQVGPCPSDLTVDLTEPVMAKLEVKGGSGDRAIKIPSSRREVQEQIGVKKYIQGQTRDRGFFQTEPNTE